MKISLSIPKPCHEPWQEMKPEATGRFCASCQHTVMDLTRASDAELVRLFTSEARPKCARFDPLQLERALSNEPPANHMIPTVAFGSLLAMLAPEKAAAQGAMRVIEPQAQVVEPDPYPIMLGEMAIRQIEPEVKGGPCAITGDTIVVEPPPMVPRDMLVGDVDVAVRQVPPQVEILSVISGQARVTSYGIKQQPEPYVANERLVGYPRVEAPDLPFIVGRVVDDATREALPFVNITIKGGELGCSTDLDGYFRLMLPDSLRDSELGLTLSYVGYSVEHFTALPVEVAVAGPAPAVATVKDARSISGFINDPVSGFPVEGVEVRIDRTDAIVRSDANGFFALHLPDRFAGTQVHVIATAFDGTTFEVNVSADKLPVSIPMELPARKEALPKPIAPKEGLVLTMRAPQELPGLVGGAIVVMRVTPTQRIMAPVRRIGNWVSGMFQR